jgi:hypothetical protein
MAVPYLSTHRRMLLDMHVTDFDPSFMRDYDPVALADLYVKAKATGVMLYCNSHVGLTYYPSPTESMHPGLVSADPVAELVDALHDRRISACAYYSVLFDNQGVTKHPEWWVQPIQEPNRTGGGGALPRYGIVCPNNEDYVELTQHRITDLLQRYEFDCLFCDMCFWAVVCGCARCRDRFRAESGAEIPESVDWRDETWLAFQAAREEWIRTFVRRIVSAAKDVRPELPVYNNFALSVGNWVAGFPLDMADEVDFLGGDMYGDRTEQLFVSKLMLNLTKHRPAEFMTSLCLNLTDHVRLRSEDELRMKAFAAVTHNSACLFIDAVDPSGRVDPFRYEMVGRIFGAVAPYEEHFGGQPVEDVAVYHSSSSRMSGAEDGTHVGAHQIETLATPHQKAALGACQMLQRAHLPFGVITRKQLADLDRYAVVVLPDVTRLDDAEAAALTEYAARGGRVYASGASGEPWVTTQERIRGAVLYGRFDGPLDVGQRYVSITGRRGVSVPLIASRDGVVLASLTTAYGHPHPGTVLDRNWASIHSTTPHDDTDQPLVIERGTVIYSAWPIEATDTPANERAFIGCIERLLDGRERFRADAHPSVWVTVFDQPERQRYVVWLLNYQADLPPAPVHDIVVHLGDRRVIVERLDDLAMLEVPYR